MKGSQCSQPNEQRGASRCEGPGGHEGRNWIWIWRSVSPAAGPAPISFLWLSLCSGDKAQAGGGSRVKGYFYYLQPGFPFQEAVAQTRCSPRSAPKKNVEEMA